MALEDPTVAAILDSCEVPAILLCAREGGGLSILHVSAAARARLGFELPDLVGRSLRVLRTGGARDFAYAALREACRRRESFEGVLSLATRNGPFWLVRVRAEPLPVRPGLYVLWLTPFEPEHAALPPAPAATEQLRALNRLTSAVLYLLAFDAEGRLEPVWWSPDWPARLRLDAPADTPPFRLVPAEQRGRLLARLQRLMRGEVAEIELALPAPDGGTRILRDRAAPLVREGGLVEGAVGLLEPVPPEPQTDPRMACRCARLVARLLHAQVLLVRDDGRLLWAADEPSTPLADRLRAAVGANLAMVLPADLADRWLDLVDRALAGDETVRERGPLPLPEATGDYEVVAAPADSRHALLVVRPFAPAVGLAEAPARFLPEPVPVEALRPRGGELWLLAVLAAVADGVVAVDEAGLVRWCNEAAELVFARPAEEMVGRPFSELLGPAGERPFDFEKLRRQLLHEAVGYAEVTGRRRDGELVALELSAARIEVPPGGYAVTVRDVTVRRQTEEAIRALAYYDPLTGLPNRLLALDRLGEAIERARRNRQMLAVMLVDLDRFKLVNDSLGLRTGDALLRAVAERLRATLRRSDTVARPGGDEFLLVIHAITGAEAAARVARKVLEALRPPFRLNGEELSITACVGIALWPHDGADPESLVENADTALARAKEQGRGQFCFYTTDMNAAAFERLMLESRLRRALEQSEFVVYYQPQVDLARGEVVGVEALLRWFHPEHGMVSPAEFVPLAEETGLIVPIGAWVLESACAQVRRWQESLAPELRLSVNLSARQFQDPELVRRVAEATARLTFPRRLLELEITESAVMRDVEGAISRIHELRALGVGLALDDFGTGHSSLGYLQRFPIQALKIDRAFIRDIVQDARSAALVRAIVELARTLELRVVAEGVETREQALLLRSFGCHEIQGFLFSRPLPAAELGALLASRRRLLLD